uniref:DUF6598 domain-containing protein n=1 Tax=Leersia perrieri TaxID=77586 RepID=A0A0D9X494_9ORYZ
MEMEMKKAAAAMARQRSLRNQVLGKLRKESAEEWESRVRKSLEEQNKAYLEQIAGDPEDEESQCAIDYRRFWNDVWFPRRARVPPMRFTFEPPRGIKAGTSQTLQIFSVKVAATRGGLQWPLDVFGIIAVRDIIDRNRNIVFHRTRENYQTLTEQLDPSLLLVGPTRAVVLSMPEPESERHY